MLSLPVIDLKPSAFILAYIDDGSRFCSPKQLRNYVDRVPRIDQSGDYWLQGGLSSYSCMQVIRNIMQCAWSLGHIKSACPLKEEWNRMVGRGDRKGKDAVHVVNKLLSIGCPPAEKKTLFRFL